MGIYDKSSREAGLMHKVSLQTKAPDAETFLLYQTAEAAQHFKVLFPPLSVFVEK